LPNGCGPETIPSPGQSLEELHFAFNIIMDVSDLLGRNNLRVLDLEANRLLDLSN
jgi:hypothetical protein